ncbi:response regulator [Lutibacter holmesii]|uniref:histidine kinase n=1 Tax=Lutibacter holmesii TaxID=1137985 RepID=A0ABW3WR63_9FLAO
MNYIQIGIFFLQGTLIALLLLFLFNLRKKLGIGLLFACLGLFQFMQVFLSSTVYVKIANNLLVSPGSSVFFTASLFAILLIYIKEDASETRKIIYALLITNIAIAVLITTFNWNIEDPSTYNPLNVTTNLFDNSAWVLLVGTIALFLDALLIIIVYEYISKRLPFLFWNICLTMLIAITFDTFFFSLISFFKSKQLGVIITSGLISKGVFTIFYSILFYIYLKFFETKEYDTHYFKIKDLFKTLTYRQKFEMARLDVIKTSEEIRKNEIKYQTLTNISPVGVFHTREDGYTTFVNPKWCEISGMTEKDALGSGWLKSVHPDDVKNIKTNWELATLQKQKSNTEYRFLLKDGSIKWVLGQAVPEYNSQQEIIGYVGTITDITEIKLYQQEQIKLKEKAEESNRLKSAFLANMSHEIRTPMNGILGFTGLLQDEKISIEKQQKYLEVIEKSGKRMLNLIDDIISISKIESGIVSITTEEFNINEHLAYELRFFKPEAEAKGLQLTMHTALPTNEAFIKLDKEKFVSVLTNLIKNAIKYTEKGSIDFGYIQTKNTLEFYVKDTGIGVPIYKQDAIFERFIQADIDDKMARQGIGLGLSISKAYIQLLGGKLWLESVENEGSTFYFSIPNNSTIGENNNSIQQHFNTNIEQEVKKIKVLIVEDDETSKLLLQILFLNLTCEVLHVKSGIEAIKTCKENPDINLILMDIRLPKMDGYEATKQIRTFNKNVIIIAQTAHALTGDKEKSLKAGCNEYLTKPIIKDDLLKIIKRYFVTL